MTTFREAIEQCLKTHSIVEVEQGRSFPLSESEARYATTCLLAMPEMEKIRTIIAVYCQVEGALVGMPARRWLMGVCGAPESIADWVLEEVTT